MATTAEIAETARQILEEAYGRDVLGRECYETIIDYVWR